MLRKRPAHRRLSVEVLETRAMLAGNVSVALRGSDLVIKGDDLDNQLSIAGTAPDTLVVSGLDDTGINGVTNGSVTVPGVTGSVLVNTKKGADEVQILAGTSIRGALQIRAGFGDDRLFLSGEQGSPITVGGALNIHGSLGNDRVEASWLSVGGKAVIDTSDGTDAVRLGGVSSVSGDLLIRLGLDNDELVLGDGGDLTIGGALDIHASRGDDRLTFEKVSVVGNAAINTSDGRDCVEIRDSSLTNVEVRLGQGNDDLLIGGTKVTGTARLRASNGFDTFFDATGNTSDGVTPRDLRRDLKQFEKNDGDPASFCT